MILAEWQEAGGAVDLTLRSWLRRNCAGGAGGDEVQFVDSLLLSSCCPDSPRVGKWVGSLEHPKALAQGELAPGNFSQRSSQTLLPVNLQAEEHSGRVKGNSWEAEPHPVVIQVAGVLGTVSDRASSWSWW